jgi:hypothetical protein
MVAVGSMMMVVSILEKRRLAAGEMGQRSCSVSFSFLGFFSFFFLYICFSGPLQNGTEIHFLEFLYFFEKTFEENKGKKQFMTLIINMLLLNIIVNNVI